MIIIFLLFLFSLLVRPAYAIYDPASVPNNEYGIHIADLNDLPDVTSLVNTSGGDWGYVTLVSTDNDRDHGRWQQIFNEMRRDHLIPIVRIATHSDNGSWAKPDPNSFDTMVNFFNGLNWPIENRYVVLYNEPNHANEWGGSIDPEGYAKDLVTLSDKFKKASPDFFILPAGLDESAQSDYYSLDGFMFMRRMIAAEPNLLTVIDGWTSHSYPNPGFSGSPYAVGRGTLRTYVNELTLLQSLGLSKNLPVFITETGWQHAQGKQYAYDMLSSDQVGADLQVASQTVWTDPRIVAVTPFVFSYQDQPFDHFSWKQLGSNTYYSEYQAYQQIVKVKGEPVQKEKYELTTTLLPAKLVSNSTYTLSTTIVNKGQGILNEPDNYALLFYDSSKQFTVVVDPLPTVEPDDQGPITLHVKTPQVSGQYPIELYIVHNNQRLFLEKRTITIVPPPSVRVTAQLGWRRNGNASDVTILLYDQNNLIHKMSGLTLTNNVVVGPGMSNIIPDHKYRIVVLVPYYLPRQSIASLTSGETNITMKRFYPLDLNRDGKFTLHDLWTLITNPPKDMIHLFVSP